jgi:hypothetical protein
MELKQHKEYQTIRLFAVLGLMTLFVVLLFKVVLFAPQTYESARQPAQNSIQTVNELKASGSSTK